MQWSVVCLLAMMFAGCAGIDFDTQSQAERSGTYDNKSVGNVRDSFGYSLSAGNKTTVETYDWEVTKARAVVGYSGSVQMGSVEITVRDTAGLVVFQEDFTGTSSQGVQTDRGVPGEWTIELAFTGYTGSLSLGVSAYQGVA